MNKKGSGTKGSKRDDLEAYVRERSARNPNFRSLLKAAEERRSLLRSLAGARRAAGLTQTQVAAEMNTSASAVARLERGELNPTLGTLQRFASAIGRRIDIRLVASRNRTGS